MGKRTIADLQLEWILKLEKMSRRKVAELRRRFSVDVVLTPQNEALLGALRVLEHRERVMRDIPRSQRRRRGRQKHDDR